MCSEIEASTLFVVSRFLRKRAGGVMLASGSQNTLENLLGTATDAVEILIERDCKQT